MLWVLTVTIRLKSKYWLFMICVTMIPKIIFIQNEKLIWAANPRLLEFGLFGIFSANPWFVELGNQTFHYQGRQALTEGGLVCQRWDAQTPCSHGHTDPDGYPDATVEEAGNYCRGLDSAWPWCYTISPDMRLQYCGISELLCRKY